MVDVDVGWFGRWLWSLEVLMRDGWCLDVQLGLCTLQARVADLNGSAGFLSQVCGGCPVLALG